jgi:hypothetical protein
VNTAVAIFPTEFGGSPGYRIAMNTAWLRRSRYGGYALGALVLAVGTGSALAMRAADQKPAAPVTLNATVVSQPSPDIPPAIPSPTPEPAAQPVAAAVPSVTSPPTTPAPTPLPSPSPSPTMSQTSNITVNGQNANPDNAPSGTVSQGSTNVTWDNQPGTSSVNVQSAGGHSSVSAYSSQSQTSMQQSVSSSVSVTTNR